jgi:hypothetical protein
LPVHRFRRRFRLLLLDGLLLRDFAATAEYDRKSE